MSLATGALKVDHFSNLSMNFHSVNASRDILHIPPLIGLVVDLL